MLFNLGINMRISIIIKRMFLFLFLFLCVFSSLSASVSFKNEKIRRTVLVIPFQNESGEKENDYIKFQIHNTIIRSLMDNFEIIDLEEKKLEFEYDPNILNVQKNADKVALKLGADSVIFGKYSIDDKTINIFAYSYDVIIQELVLETSVSGNKGLDIFKYFNTFSQEIANRTFEELTKYRKKMIDKIISRSKLEKTRKALIDNILNQSNKYWNYLIDRENKKEFIEIPFGKNVVVFVSEQTKNYKVEINGNINNEQNNIKIFSFKNKVGTKRNFLITDENNTTAEYKYTQRSEYEVDVKYIVFSAIEKIGIYNMYVDTLLSLSTAGYIGFDLKLGMGLPLKSRLNNSIYFRFMLGPKAINAVETNDKGIYLDYPHLKLKFGFGFEHVFFIKNMLGINLGLEIGTELNFFSFLTKNKERASVTGKLIFGAPSVYYAIPIGLQFFVTKKFGLVINVEPIFRLVVNTFVFDNKIFFEDLDETRGAGFEFLRQNVGNYLILDLFFFDMPITIGMRIKI